MEKIDPLKTAKELETFIKKTLNEEGIAGALIGVSGGIDSATSLTLAVRALGPEHVYPVLLPYGMLNTAGTSNAKLVISDLGIPKKHTRTVDIQPMTDSFFAYDKEIDAPRLGNVMARMRMAVLYDLAKKLNYLVIGTENKTEHRLGYYTRFGDEASDIEPLRNLYKTQVYALAAYLGVPEKILKSAPTAGLWEGQTDEGEFGFTYQVADAVLELHYDKKFSRQEIIKKGYDRKTVERIWWWIEKGELKDRLPYMDTEQIS